MATKSRHLIGPNLLIELCLQTARAMAWAKTVGDAHCVLSRLAVAIVRSVINKNAKDEISREEWHKSLDAVVARMVAAGAETVDLNETILEKYHLYRLHEPLQSQSGGTPEILGQDVRLLVATAAVMDLVYTDISDLYLQQMAALGLKVQAL
ncbi:hypothetical protein [Stenotrophomonas sp. YIM B06876]|uniref:hypothetical protein n=1 Tax=Stenotrophomonas sp. YIM B06876 TaxID=3060211 RepID=UPI002739F996|nr:hypothetical protein [Stenotrophomonas sp. YIM B06876]